jgi:hypothetical protein
MIWSSRRPVDPKRHAFAGFPESDAITAMLEAGLRVGTAPPEIAVHRNARVYPPSLTAPDPWRTGGIVAASGDLIPLVRDWTEAGETLLGLSAPPAEDAADGAGEVIGGDVLYLGWLFDNFGHLLLESLARVWALRLVPDSTRVLVHYWPGVTPPAATLAVLACFGIAPERIIIPAGPVTCASLLIPDPTLLLTSMVHERAGTPYREVADRITGDAPPSDQPLYLSRTNLPGDKRSIVGEAALEAVLRDNGFLILHPETMPFTEQIRAVTSHRTIALCKGAAAELLLFARPETRVHLFASRPLLEVNVLVAEAAGARTTFHNALRWRANSLVAARLDLDAAIAGLAADGLLPNLSRLPYLPSDDDLDSEFDETWLFAMLTWPDGMDDDAIAEANAALASIRPTAWPTFAALAARVPADRLSDQQADRLMLQFAAALLEEPDARRRFRYAGVVRSLADDALARCTPRTRMLASQVIESRLPVTS